MSMSEIACIGEAMVELSLDSSRKDLARIGFAGDTLNTAIYLKRCAPDLSVHFVTRLGMDRFSDDLERFVAAESIETNLIGRSDTRSVGLYAISTDADGERSFSYWRDTSAARSLFDEGFPDFADLQGFAMIYFSAITLAILTPAARTAFLDWLPRYRSAGGKVAFDSNFRPALWPDVATARAVVSAAWAQTDIALPSVDDEMELFGDKNETGVLSRLRDSGIEKGALKRGALGPVSILPDSNDPLFRPVANVVDSTAAGDSFNGGYLAAYLNGSTQSECLTAGHELASRVVQSKGAILSR